MLHIYVPLAESEKSHTLGPLAIACITEAIREEYVQSSPRCTQTYFALGNGVLAGYAEAYLRTAANTVCGKQLFVNHDPKYDDILGQVKWLLNTLHWQLPRRECCVHFFGSRGQLFQAKLVLKLFFPHGRYKLHRVEVQTVRAVNDWRKCLYYIAVKYCGVRPHFGHL